MSLVVMRLSVCPTITAHVQRSAFPHRDCSSTQEGIPHSEQSRNIQLVQESVQGDERGSCARGLVGRGCARASMGRTT